MTKIGLYDIANAMTLESNRSVKCLYIPQQGAV